MELIPRYNHASKIAFICLVFFIQSYDTLSQLQMQIPPQAAVYSGSTRGYWFEAPADFTIVGLRVPTDASSASQSIAVVRFNGGAPPLYNSTTNDFTILALYQAVQGNSIISVNLPISDGDYIGVLGSRGGNSINSYGANNYSTNIGGDPVTLGRLGMQYDLQSTSPINLWRENSGSISRVELYYSTAGLFSQDSIVACNVDSTQLSPDSSWSNYTWSTGDTTQTTYVSNSGLYYLTVTDTSSNLWTDSVYVNISNPVAQASIVPTDCESTANGVITASGFGGHEPYQYVWSNGSTSASINTLETGLYSLTITDILGCQNDNLFILSALDTIPPSISTQNISVYLDANGEANITASQINNGSADNCGIDSFAINFSAFDCDDAGVNVVTLTAWDTTGNSSSAASNVTVLDTIPPSISTQNISVYLDANGEANIAASQINNGSADNCGIDSFAINFSAFDCDDAGVNVVTLTAWDTTGNSSSATANVTILDTLSPIILANHDTIFLDSFGQAILTSSAIDAGTFDNCTLLYTDVSDSLFGCSDVNNAHLVWFIASDIFGNTDSMPKSIYVKDAIAPEIICLDTIAVLNDSGQCGAVVQFTEPTAFDNCSIDMMTKFDSTGLDSGMFFPVGITELSYAVFDQSGNSDTCSVVVEVIDTQAPILLCAPDTQICDSIFTFNLPNYFDNCSELDIQHFEGPASGTFHPVGTTVHRFSILDPSGNSDTCSFEVLRYDYPSIAEAGDNQNLCEEIAIDIEGNTPAVGNGYWTKISGNGIIADTNLSNTTFADFGYGIILLSWNIENGVCPIESDTISINNFSDSATINAGVDVIICDTSSTILSSVKPEIGSYYWNSPLNGASISDTEITNPTVIGLEVGDYEFVWSVINGSCPPGADTVTVSIKPEPVIVSSDSSYIFASSSIDIDASSDIPVNYSWFNSSFAIIDSGSTINIRPESTETYIVQGITEFGCVSFDSVYIQVNESLEIPSAFTPDEDGFNDVWNLKELASYPKCEVRIFNRWGHTLFESTGYDTPWDGTVNGEPLPGGAYFFVIDLKVNELNPLTGSITIIK
jgi:gliding motility-associated-like protein